MQAVVFTLGALALVVAGVAGAALWRHRAVWFAPPGFAERMTAYLTTNVAKTERGARFPELETRRYTDDVAALAREVRAACHDLGWQVTPHERGCYAVVSTRWLKFRDDLSATVRAQHDDGLSVLDVCSRSRVGKGDLGANARHIVALLSALDARLAHAKRDIADA